MMLNTSRAPGAVFQQPPEAARFIMEFLAHRLRDDNKRRLYINAVRRFGEWCASSGIERLSSLGVGDLDRYLVHLHNECSESTARRSYAALLILLEYLISEGILVEIRHSE